MVREELVDEEVIRADPNRTVLRGMIVDAVVEDPGACHPSYVQGYCDRDNRFYVEWDAISRDADTLVAWLDDWVCGTRDHSAYLSKLGEDRWNGLVPSGEAMSPPVDYGRYG